MVKASVMAGNRGGLHRKELTHVDVDGDYGLPLTSPELIIPIVGLILLGILGLITCLCKFFSCWCFRKQIRDKDLELQLGRKRRTSTSFRKQSESLKSPSSVGGHGGGIEVRSPSTKGSTRSEDRRKNKSCTIVNSPSTGSSKPQKSSSFSNPSRNHSNSLTITRSNSHSIPNSINSKRKENFLHCDHVMVDIGTSTEPDTSPQSTATNVN